MLYFAMLNTINNELSKPNNSIELYKKSLKLISFSAYSLSLLFLPKSILSRNLKPK